ncbi:hypothetical protein CU313_01280 [Prochlorococcus marinus str. MU1404]|uniref:DUF3769 domain-containing protein n=1 Tax=Prochlorococcus marinus TaxID=1219 RepID=UPI001ADA79A7|nr:DUF3769 domain-containing protein [Prochlorococcus marinus]MBO8229426.1 DUF3769 domain-containing protein [Prochlorococcus marinus XMU1404]MBW3072509.1 hypothetical protein [Prochlorococcus marinus str. MU1404]MCR8544390.1 DUF3769 domain-containing protein [Prochlorococcus marinus CUG1432]
MTLGIAKKFIFTSFLFINFIQPTKSADLQKINNGSTKGNLSKKVDIKKSFNFSNSFSNTFHIISSNHKLLNKNSGPLKADIQDNYNQILIQSDQQSELNGIIYAEGNVIVEYRGKILKADNLIYDKSLKKISANGNIALVIEDQVFKTSELEYSFIDEKGYLLDVKGSFNTDTLMDDLSANFSSSDLNKIKTLLEFKKSEVLNTPGKVVNWLFSTDKITIDGEKWRSKKAVFSNDLLEFKQVRIVINSLEVIPEAEKLRFKSSINHLIFDEKLSIPFWVGDRTLSRAGGISNVDNRWNLGYENLDKDGYFIGRKFNPIDISDDFTLDLEPQFLIQRSLKGYTKSFVNNGESITSERVKRNANLEDYFALKSKIKGRINNWDLEIDKNLSSFSFEKFSDAFRLKTKFSKEINFLDSNWDKSLYGIYRERVWNGSLGEAEIYSGYGSKLQKENSWVVNGIKKRETFSLGLADITAEALNTKILVTNLKGNVFYALDQEFPLSIKDPKSKSVDVSYKYISEPITKGLTLNTRLEASYSFYENGEHQDYLGLGMGPELTLGNFKNKTFDYTRISLFPFYRFNSGESVFKFDQNNDNFTLNIAYDQQLFGPIILKSEGTLNLTSDAENYGEFINSKISLNWKKRSYELGIYYQPHNQAGGVSFNLFGFR